MRFQPLDGAPRKASNHRALRNAAIELNTWHACPVIFTSPHFSNCPFIHPSGIGS